MRGIVWGCLLLLLGTGSGFGCGQGPSVAAPDGPPGAGGTGGAPPGRGVGDECNNLAPCRLGLVCNPQNVCEPGHGTPQAGKCSISAECQAALQCSGGSCQPTGSGEQGTSCRDDLDCQTGLRCLIVGFGAQCGPEGSGDVGKDCATSRDCFAGLACVAGKCAPPPPGAPPFGISAWKGVTCDEQGSDRVRAFFEVPRANPPGQDGDFFRLPFPNDHLLRGAELELTGFPTPGSDLLGFDPVKLYVDAASNPGRLGDAPAPAGFSTYPTAIFRFSKLTDALAGDKGTLDYDVLRDSDAVNWVDITSGTPEYGSSAGHYWYASEGRSQYICAPYLAVRRPQGAPLVPGHVYGVWVTTSAVDTRGEGVQPSDHFQAMLSDQAPSDAELLHAHQAFSPFRAYLKDKGIAPSTILTATVITASAVRDPMQRLAAAVEQANLPTAASWVKCGAGAASPCPQAEGDRACGSSDPGFDEYHALVTLPVFQQGSPPYETDGGGIDTNKPPRAEQVCMALTVPKASMPAAGWPLVVFAHGTGGSFRSHVRAEIAGALSNVTTPGGASVKFAVLGIDQVEHGPRRGGSTKSPNDLFFNFTNPAAARGNPLQGAADQIALGRYAAELDTSVGGTAIKIDPAKLVFFGHSQGSTHASLALPYTAVFKAAVLSGNGASLTDALLTKKSPVNIAAALPFVIVDVDRSTGGLNGGDMHPVLTMLQQWIDPADPLNFARAIAIEPPAGGAPKHVFQSYGLGDTFSPAKTLATYAISAGLDLASPDPSLVVPENEKISGLTAQPVPLRGNGPGGVTLAVRQYEAPAGKDGHFVAFDVAAANADIARFLAMAAAGEIPQVGP